VVLLVTATGYAVQILRPGTLDQLQRAPAGLHGEWWRTLTALVVQDGGVAGAVSNLAALAILGAIAERVVPRPRWTLHYVGVGLAAELVGYAWQPVGGGNSIAVCGLTGAVVGALLRRDPRLPAATPTVLLLWFAALLVTADPRLRLPAIFLAAVGAALPPLRGRLGRLGRHAPLGAAGAGLAIAVGLVAVRDIHGAALALGLALEAVTAQGAARADALHPGGRDARTNDHPHQRDRPARDRPRHRPGSGLPTYRRP
jgi:membrane associated rhomboid family serine protease